MTQYVDETGRPLFVSDGISGGRTWATYRRKPSGSLQRVKTKALPLRSSREAAQDDLDEFARRRKLERAPG